MVQGESERSLLQNSEAPTGVGSHGGRPTVGAMSPSMHLDPPLSFGKKKVSPWPQLSPSGKKKKLYTRPQLSPSGGKKSVHLAPTLLRERRGDLTVRGGLRAGSQRLM